MHYGTKGTKFYNIQKTTYICKEIYAQIARDNTYIYIIYDILKYIVLMLTFFLKSNLSILM